MEPDEARSARQALARVPGFTQVETETARFTRLRGLTNRVYAVETADAQLCLRIPGEGTGAIIDRRAEEANARRAAAAGVAPEILYFGDDGLMLTPLIADAVPLSTPGFRERTGAVERAALASRQLHEGAAAFVGEFRAFDTVERYHALLVQRGSASGRGLAEAMREAEPLRTALERCPAALKPCHCDPSGANLLDTGERVWLIDWEYSGMNDPLWDLAYLSLQAGFDDVLDARLLAAYRDRPPRVDEAGRMAAQKAACELLSAAWALVQDSGGNQIADFRAYADVALRKFRKRIRTAEFAGHLRALSGR